MKNQMMKMDKAIPMLDPMKIDSLESEMLKYEQVECPVIHRFGPGTYIREVHIPAGSLAIGHRQNFEHTNIMLKGRVSILNDDGTLTEFKAPMIFVGKPGRKIGFIHEDVTWLNVYPNVENEQSIDVLEAKYLTKSESFVLAEDLRLKLLTAGKSNDQLDFEKALLELNVSAETVRIQSENTEDMTPLPFGSFKVKVAQSQIEGKGVFATGDFTRGEIIGPARIEGKRTMLGRYTNHSAQPNAQFVRGYHGNIDLVALDKIFGCRGGFDGDEITVNYRDAVRLNLEISEDLKCQE